MKSCGVIGYGHWGTALALHAVRRGLAVSLWGRNTDHIQQMKKEGKNPRFFPDTPLPQALTCTDQIEDLWSLDTIIVALPSPALSDLKPLLSGYSNGVVISAVKGFEVETLATPLECFARHVSPEVQLAVLSGPSFAIDLVRGHPVSVVCGARDAAVAAQVASVFSDTSMRVYASDDPKGVELGGTLKNVIALACGVCDGMGLGESARAALITRGLSEMTRLALALGAQSKTLFGLSGLGDLVMTASCDTSRNRSAGILLGKGMTLAEVQHHIGSVVEGIHTTPRALALAQKNGVELPICETVQEILSGALTPAQAVKKLMSRPLKREF